MKNVGLVALTILLIGIFVFIGSIREFQGLNFEGEDIRQNIRLGLTIWLAFVLLIGVFIGHIYRFLAKYPPNTKVRMEEIVGSVNDVNLWRSLISSPIVFGVVYIMAREQPDLVVSSILAFENGFICNVVLERRLTVISEE
ncbi:hypothetical protein [Mastigocoleus sp. MO_188.B34]|uniref:hypothetical protein n=1 Tax=Mastigocoleus sp. MO_188.B34 TaxID=3036635 RepID=UPI00260C6549|nr:hypothetical protein [Mastigocoleus sp. MO_188.B34]MDJ0698163.1 hypothetical protein [Mastigocoleus sp. MO_188.B34]